MLGLEHLDMPQRIVRTPAVRHLRLLPRIIEARVEHLSKQVTVSFVAWVKHRPISVICSFCYAIYTHRFLS